MDTKTRSSTELSSEALWVEELTQMPAAKPLVQHFSAFEAIVRSGGQKGVEPPIDQASTWRRMFCWEYSKSDNPFGISGSSGTLPKCVAICNLSGQHTFYYSNTYNLGKILCLTPIETQPRVIRGVSKLFDKAEEMGASVLVCFCLPFQTGLERCYWEARTIRKTAKGVVKDGEMSFCISDREPRVVSCTLASEHWPAEMFEELNRKFMNVASPVCLDKTEKEDRSLTPEKMSVAIQILKMDRKKLIEHNAMELEMTNNLHRAEIEKLTLQINEADQKADKRVSGVISSCKASEETAKQNLAAEKENNMNLMKKVSSLNEELSKVRSQMAEMLLENEEQSTKAAARQKTMQAQLSQMTSSHAKQVADHSRLMKQLTKDHQKEIQNRDTTISDLQKQLSSAKSASSAVSAGAKEAFEMKKKLELQLKDAKIRARVMRGVVHLISNRAVDREFTMKRFGFATETSLIKELQAVECIVNEIRDSSKKHMDELASLKMQLTEKNSEMEMLKQSASSKDDSVEDVEKVTEKHKREMDSKNHLVSELQKRTAVLESKLKESDAEIRRLKSQSQQNGHALAPPPQGPKKKGAKTDEHQAGSNQQLNIHQNTAVFMNQPPHQQAFPQGPYSVDPALEGMISQLHSALNCVTAMARSSSTHKRNAEIAQGKVDAFYGGYYDPSCTAPQPQFYGNGY